MGKTKFQRWTDEIVSDVRALTRSGPLTVKHVHDRGLCLELHRDATWADCPEWITGGELRGRIPLAFGHSPEVLEVVCAARAQFDNTTCGPRGWVSLAARGLFARPSWVEFFRHACCPRNVPYHKSQERHAEWIDAIWVGLLGCGYAVAHRWSLNARWGASQSSPFAGNFWVYSCDEPLLWE